MNVYVVVFELLNAGDHVPVIPSMDVAGNGLADPAHSGARLANVGTFPFVIVTVAVVTPENIPV